MRRVIASLLCAALSFLATGAPAVADRVITYPGQLGSSTEQNQGPRFQRLAFGTWMRDALGPTTSAGGVYSNLTVVPNGGMYVATQPTLPSTMGSLYQIAVDDANQLPANGTPNLAPDSTKIVVQALQGGVSSSLGPISAPGSGLSQYYIVEAQVQTTDTTPTSMTFTSANGSYTNVVNVTRADQIVYQLKAGTASSSPVAPTVDTGWIGIATVLVPSGTASITTGMIAPLPSFTGFLANDQAATLSALTLQGFGNGCLQVAGSGIVQSLPCTSGLGVVNGTAGQINVSTVAGAATVSLAHGDYADLINAQTIGGSKTFSSTLVEEHNLQIPSAGTATSTTNYGSAGAYYLYNSLWNGSSAVSHSWELIADSAGNLLMQYDGSTQGEVSNTGTATFTNAIISGLSASACVATNGSEQLVSATGCLTSIAAGSCLVSSGGGAPTLSLSTPLPTSCGGTDATSYTSGALFYYTGTSFASATVNSPLGISGGALGCATCVTLVTGTGNIASTGGTTPSLSFTGLLPILNGGGNASSYTSGDLLYYDGTRFNSASVSSPFAFSSGALNCPTCAVTNADNNFSTGQTINGSLLIPPSGTATSSTNYGSIGGIELQASIWNGSAPVAYTTEMSETNAGVLNWTYNGGMIANLNAIGTFYSNDVIEAASSVYAGVHSVTTCNAGDLCGAESSATGELWLGNDSLDFGKTTSGIFTFEAAAAAPYFSATSTTLPGLLTPWTNGIDSVLLGTATNCHAAPAIATIVFCAPSGTTQSFMRGDVNGINVWYISSAGTFFTEGGTIATSVSDTTVTNTLAAMSSNGTIGATTIGNGLTWTAPALSVTGCGAATCREPLNILLGAESGAVATSDPFSLIGLASASGASVTVLYAFCVAADNGTTVFDVYKDGSSTALATLTLGTTTVSSTTFTAVSLVAGDYLQGAIKTAGTASGCTFELGGTQNVE